MNRFFDSHLFRVALSLVSQSFLAMLFIASLCAGAATLPTGASAIFEHDRILWAENMPALANQGALITEWTAVHIGNMAQWFQVIRVDAVTHSALVIQFHTIRYGSNQPLVSDYVSLSSSDAIVGGSVAFIADRPNPKPACSGLIYLLPKEGNRVASSVWPTARSGQRGFGSDAFTQATNQSHVAYDASLIPRPVHDAFSFTECGNEFRCGHSSSPVHDLQLNQWGNRHWSERVSARENLSPQLFYQVGELA